MNFILDWKAAAAAGSSRAGGKGWQLGLLAGMGLPVPAGFVIDAAASRLPVDGEALPGAVHDAIARELARRGWDDVALAVRSSAAQEDSAHASFAGIHRSCLNVRGIDAVLAAVREVWDSRASAEARAYRQRLGLDATGIGMAVVVMPLLPAVAAGIAFTCDPVSGRDDQLVIHANWGLGESLVGGQAEGDEYRLQARHPRDALALVERRRGGKHGCTVPATAGGTELHETPSERAAAWVLDTRQAVALGALVRETATALDYADPAFDVEWVWDGAAFWIVQARPVTVRVRHEGAGLAGQPLLWSRGNSRDVMPDPLSPMDWSLARPLLERMLTRTCALGGCCSPPGARRVALRRGRLYFETALMQWEMYAGFGVAPAAYNQMMGGEQSNISVPPATPAMRLRWAWHRLRFAAGSAWTRLRAGAIFADAHRDAARRMAAALPDDNAALGRELCEQAARMCSADALFLLQAAGSAVFVLLELAETHCPGEGQALVAALLAGGPPSVTAAQAYALMDLANVAAGDRAALAWLRGPQRRGEEWAQSLPAGSAFRRAFVAFLERYGHRAVYESYLHHPRWRESPDYLFDSVLHLIDSEPAALRRRQAQVCAEARARLRKALPLRHRLALPLLVRIAANERNLREAARSAMTAQGGVLRRQALAIGERLLDGVDAGDVFRLTLDEACALAEGRLRPEAAVARVRWRRRQGEDFARQADPEVVIEPVDAAHAASSPSPALPAASADAGVDVDADAWQGVTVSAGRAAGPACVARHPREALRMPPGGVLVAPSTDPSWTPAFLRAGALVMETGGYLSHGAIVAREFGIPAIVNLPGVLDRVADGEWLDVDGGRGSVRRCDAGAAR